MAHEGIDFTVLTRNHTSGVGHSWQSLAMPTPNSIRHVRAWGGLGASQGPFHCPSHDQGSWSSPRHLSGAWLGCGPTGGSSCTGPRPGWAGLWQAGARPAAASLRGRGWQAWAGWGSLGKAGQRQVRLRVPSAPWEDTVGRVSRSILIPRNLETGLFHRATGIFCFVFFDLQNTQSQHAS